MRRRLPYPLVCALMGLVLGWAPKLVHGPIPEKYNLHYIQGAIAVWAWYNARMLVGFLVGITAWPSRWYLRGPLCGLIMLFPLGFMSLATPECGLPCMFYNCTTASLVGLTIGGLAYLLTGRHHLYDEPRPAAPQSVADAPGV